MELHTHTVIMQAECFVETTLMEGMVECAIRLVAPESTTRNPIHIILLIDISESMEDSNKLENVKVCCQSMLQFLQDHDRISLITFGETAQLHLQRVAADETNKTFIRERIQTLQVNGCTNLSAGLGYVHTILDSSVDEGNQQKTGLLLLTDGHANRGVSEPSELRSIMQQLHTKYDYLSIHNVAYGADHNQSLLRAFAEDNAGSYNVVNTIEDTAFAFGDALGGLMSCAYQNVVVELPLGSIVHGPWKTTQENSKVVIQVGDVYSGTKPLILCKIPDSGDIVCKGMELPTYVSWSKTPSRTPIETRMIDIELTRLRYKCTELLQSINQFRVSRDDASALQMKINEFEHAVQDTFFNGHPIANLLRNEVSVCRTLLEEKMNMGFTERQEIRMVAEQHIASIGLGRGFSSPMAHHRRRRRRSSTEFTWGVGAGAVRIQTQDPYDEDENPITLVPESAPSEEVTHLDESCFQNPIQTQLATLMRHASQPHNHS